MNERIQEIFRDKELLNYLIGLKRREETQRKGSDLDQKPIQQFSYLIVGMDDQVLLEEFMRMQKTYVFDDEYLISKEELQNGIGELRELFK